ncbi:putative drug exporter of the RND superfamily [Nocardioides exalbidus]|uniref:Putative drug exporter of the RND superfamily n=1 Tax=Nocardioides exalbidus TaxID=402596 RepID=A0A1H4K6E2_9ACTN|nr:putative drug exporter of the RND superfamily [Nocardioides exalbidus]
MLATWAGVVVLGGVLGGGVFDLATTPEPVRPDAESALVERSLETADPEGERVVAVLSGRDVMAVELVDQASRVLHGVRELTGVHEVRDPWTTGARDLVAPTGSGTVVTVELDPGLDHDEALALAADVSEDLRTIEMPGVLVGGPLLAEEAFAEQAISDAARGEGVAVVVLLVVLVLALGGIAAGVLPVVTALASVAGALLVLASLARLTPVSDYAVNVVTLLGLGLAVDYALLVLARFREERARQGRRTDEQGAVADALATTLATAGRAVLVSGLTVGTALTGLLLLGDPVLSPMAVGGLVAVGVSTAAGLTLTPPLLAVAHRRIPPPPAGGRLLGGTPSPGALLPRLARTAQRRPWPVLLGCTALLLLLASPLLALDLRNSDARSLPRDSEPRQAQEVVDAAHPDLRTTPLTVLAAEAPDSPEVATLLAGIGAMEHVDDVLLLDPMPDGSSRVMVEPTGTSDGPDAQALVGELRQADLGVAVRVGGPAAELVDTRAALAERVPWAVLLVVVATALLVGRLSRSVAVPAKAVLLNLLSLCATLGVVVAIFQWGWGSSLLGFDPWGALDITTPLLLFMFAFGLSMDYHVFLVARIREAWDAPRRRTASERERNDDAVLDGIVASGPVVTLAAVAIGIVFLGFVAGELVAVKEIGVGMAVAVLLDVTIVRGLLLPAAMTLLGRWNWWLPGSARTS